MPPVISVCLHPIVARNGSDVIHRDLKSAARSWFCHSNSKPPSRAKEDRKEGDGQKETEKYKYLWNMRRIARTLFFLALGCLLCEAGKWKEKYPIRKPGELVESFVGYLNFLDIVV